MLRILGQKLPFAIEELDAYDDNGGKTFTPATALGFEELRRRFQTTGDALQRALPSLTAEQAAKPAPFSPTGNPNETVGSLAATAAFHDAYHVGQMGVLRRVAGKAGAVKPPKI